MILNNRMKHHYYNVIFYDIIAKTSIKNILEVPKLDKISLNFGFPNVGKEKKQILAGLLALELIGGQKAYPTYSKKQIRSLKIRKGMIVGSASTLRGLRMFLFLNELNQVILPNYRNFDGFSLKKDVQQNFISFRLRDLYLYPIMEKEFWLLRRVRLLNVSVVFAQSKLFKKYPNLLHNILLSLQIPLKIKE